MTSLPFLYTDFHGGLNTRAAPYLLEDSQARDLNNVQGTSVGAITKRGGLVTFASLGPFTSLYACEATSVPYLIGATGTVLNAINTSGAVAYTQTGLTSGKRWEFVQASAVSGQGPLYGMNGTDPPQQFTGSAFAAWTATDTGGAVPNGTYCLFSQNQVFVAGVAANPSRVYFSAIGDPTGWNPANNKGAGFIDFDPGDGQAITGLGLVGPYVLVCKPRKLFIIMQPGNAAVAAQTRRLSSNIGCPAHRSLASDATGTYFLAEDRGVYVTNGSKITPISDQIQPNFDTLAGSRSLAVGACFDGHYYLSVPASSATNDTVLDFDTVLNSWWKHSFGSNQFTILHGTSGPELYSAKSTGAYIDQAFVAGTYTDNGNPMPWSWSGPWQSPTFYRRRRFPTPYYRKRLRQLRFDGYGNVDFSLAKDFSGGAVQLGTNVFNYSGATQDFAGSGYFGAADGSVWGGTPSLSRARYFSLGVANAFSLVFSGTTSDPATVYSYVLEITDRKDLIVS